MELVRCVVVRYTLTIQGRARGRFQLGGAAAPAVFIMRCEMNNYTLAIKALEKYYVQHSHGKSQEWVFGFLDAIGELREQAQTEMLRDGLRQDSPNDRGNMVTQ